MLELIEFAAEFVHHARKEAVKYPNVSRGDFTNRQSNAIAAMGIARILRTRRPLEETDLINLAVTTTFPKGQKYAEMIALRTIYGEVKLDFSADVPVEPVDESIIRDNQLTAKSLILEDLLDFLQLDTSVVHEDKSEELKFAEELEENIFPDITEENDKGIKDQKKHLENVRKRIAYEVIGGRRGIIEHNVTSDETLLNVAREIIVQMIPSIDNQHLIYSQILGHSNLVSTISRENTVILAANLLLASEMRDIKEISHEIEEIRQMSELSIQRYYFLFRMYRDILARFEVSEDYYAPLLQGILDLLQQLLRKYTHDLSDLYQNSSAFTAEHLDREFIKEILDNTAFDTPTQSMREAMELDALFGTNLAERIGDQIHDRFEKLDMDDLLGDPLNSPIWEDAVREKIKELSWDELDKFSNYADEVETKNINEDRLMETIQREMLERMISQSRTFEELQESISKLRKKQLSPDYSKIVDQGRKLKLSKQEMAKLTGNPLMYLKSLMESQQVSYEETKSLFGEHKLTQDQMQELANLAASKNQTGVLGFIAEDDLSLALGVIQGKHNSDGMAMEIVSAGGGENLLDQWFLHGKRLPARFRNIVKEAAKQVMIDLAKVKASMLIGSSEAGNLPEGTYKPYMVGDDAETIDIDETIENIIMLGKSLDHVTPDDFVVRKTVNGRRCVIFLIDISGSMSGRALASASLATAMLLTAFSKDEIGVALFESNTHVICEVNEDIEIDVLIDEILELTARGGTQMSRAVLWAREQLEDSQSADKMFIMLTDAMIADFGACVPDFTAISDMGTTSVLIMPEMGYGRSGIQNIVESVDAQLVHVRDWRKFPEVVSRVLSRV